MDRYEFENQARVGSIIGYDMSTSYASIGMILETITEEDWPDITGIEYKIYFFDTKSTEHLFHDESMFLVVA